jgi:aminopeptidase N
MKKFIFLLALLPVIGKAQMARVAENHACAKAKQRYGAALLQQQAREASLSVLTSHELKYDVKFVKLDLNLERTTTFIKGGVTTVATATMALDTFMTILHQNLTVDSIRFNGTLYNSLRQDSMVKVGLPAPLAAGASFTVNVYYNGTPPAGGSAIGSAFDRDSSANSFGNAVTWSLSEPVGAYQWWPCKQILADKIDSSWVFVTTDSSNKVGSNGRLMNVVPLGNKKRHEWKSRKPINFYLISVAVSNYTEYNFYAKPQYLVNDSILVQNYIYKNAFTNPSWINSEKVDLDQLPQVIKLYSNLFGMYPFYKEKYGHCMASFGGGQEHQTMTSLGFFDYYIDAHELGHQWWGDNVTCKDWNDIWMNEGWATYTEFITGQYLDPSNFAAYLGQYHTYIMSLPGGSCYFPNTLNSNTIFDSRLTYAKGGAIIRSLQFVTNNDSVWFNTLRGFQNTYKNSNASVVDFKNYYQAQTGIDPTQFFDQWYYGEGFPSFAIRYYKSGNTLILKSTQTVSKPTVTPLFITPMEYRISRTGYPDTTLRLTQTSLVETFYIPMSGTVTLVKVDPDNWIINKTLGPIIDPSLDTGIPSIAGNGNEMSIGPNPGTGMFTLNNPARIAGKVSVWGLDGKLIFEKKLDGSTQLDLNRYAHGLYEVRVFNEDGGAIFSRKIIKE